MDDYQRFADVLDYNPESGAFTWKQSANRSKQWNAQWAGKVAGSPNKKGYWQICVYGKSYYCHRLAWLLTHKEWPSGMLDHEDRNPGNNRIKNLRPATRSQNGANRPGWGKLPKGVARVGNNKFRGQLMIIGKRFYTPRFDTPEEAHEAYLVKARELWGVFGGKP